MATPSYVSQPTATVREKFTVSGGGKKGDAGPSPIVRKGKVPPQAALPPPLSMDQIDKFYSPIRDELNALPPPQPMPVPPHTPPLNAFLSLLAGNLGSSLTRNPAQAQQISEYLINKEQERKAIESQNFATRVAFDQNRRNQLIAIRAKSLDTALEEAIKSGDTERAAKIAQNQMKLGSELKAEVETPAETQGRIAQEQERGRQDRLTLAEQLRLTLEKETGSAGKPLTAQQFQKAIDDVNKDKELTTEEHGVLGNVWRYFFGGNNKVNKRDMLRGTYVTGLLAGESGVRQVSKRRLTTMLLADLGFLKKYKPGQDFTPDDEAKVRKAFADLGLDYDRDVAVVP